MEKIVIVGPGALGCLFAARLAARKIHKIQLLDHSRERAALLSCQGIKLLDNGQPTAQFDIQATANPNGIDSADLVLLCVKSYHVRTTLPLIAPFTNADTLLIAFQNGISHLPLLNTTPSSCSQAVGVTSMGATLTGPGEVRFGGIGPTQIGFLTRPSAYAEKILENAAAILTAAGITTTTTTDIKATVWAKLLTNIGINALTVINDCENGKLLDIPEARQMLTTAVLEAEAVARALKIKLENDPVEKAFSVCRATAKNISSMLQDIRKKRPTEIDAINGALVNEAHHLGLAVPTNEELVRRVKTLENAT